MPESEGGVEVRWDLRLFGVECGELASFCRPRLGGGIARRGLRCEDSEGESRLSRRKRRQAAAVHNGAIGGGRDGAAAPMM
jgi:hypothetical protein